MENLYQMFQLMTQNQALLSVVIGLIAIFLMFMAFRQFRRYHPIRAGFCGCFSALCFCLLVIFLLLLGNLYTYQRFSTEKVIAHLSLAQLGEQDFHASLKLLEDHSLQQFLLRGDEWQIDARILKWTYPVQWLGFDAHYQLDRISGRYMDVSQERIKNKTVHSLKNELSPDLWPVIRKHQKLLPFIDAYYGSATYLPMFDGAQYEIRMGLTGLIARPMNQAANKAIINW